MAESEEADRVLGATTLYEVLRVERTCTDDEIKKSYRRIAVKVHPDRCKHPRATEAFQRISHAYQTLSDPDKRAHYDRFGDRPAEPTFEHHKFGQRHGPQYFYEGEISPEEIFEMFFGMQPGMGRQFHFQRPPPRQQRPPQEWGLQDWLRMLMPFLTLLFFLFISNSSSEQPLRNVIHFGNQIDRFADQVLLSERLKKQFGVPKRWLQDHFARNRWGDRNEFYRALKYEADVLYLERIEKRCHAEGYTESPTCQDYFECKEKMAM